MYKQTRTNIYNFKEIPAFDKRKTRQVSRIRVAFRKYIRLYKYFALGIVLLLVLHLAQKYVLTSETFRISKIEVYGTKSFVNKGDIETQINQKVFGQYYFSVDTSSLSDVLSESFQGAKKITVSKKFPNTVVTTVIERTPLAIVTNPKSDVYYLVDDEGYILGIVAKDNTNLPVIEYNDVLHVGLAIDKSTVPIYLELLTSIDKEELKASTISIQPRHFGFYVDGKIEVAIGRDKNITQSIMIVSNLLKQLKLEGKDVKKIDLRYDKVVVGLNE